MIRGWILAALAAAGLLAWPSVAGAAWLLPPEQGWGSNLAQSSEAAMGPDGDAAAAFTSGVTTPTVTFRPAGGPTHAEEDAWNAGIDTVNNPVRMDAGGGGLAAAAHRETVGAQTRVLAHVRTAAGTWTDEPLTPVFGDASTQPNPEVDMARGGAHAAVVWIKEGHVQVSRLLPSGSFDGGGEDLGPAGGAQSADVAVGPDGTTAVAWHDSAGALKVRRFRAGVWTDAKTPAPRSGSSTGTSEEQVVVSDAGAVTIVRRDGTDVVASTWPADQTSPGAETELATAVDADRVSLASGGGPAAVSFVEGGAGKVRLVGSGTTVDVAGGAGDAVSAPALAVDAGGRVIVAYTQAGKTRAKAGLPSALAGQAAQTLSDVASAPPSAAIDDEGDGVVLVPTDGDPSDPSFAAAFYDATGPRLGSIAVPATTVAGAATPFSVSPFEPISSLATTTWNFGDGTSATGTNVSHAYSDAGTYAVQVTSTDSSGNATSATRTIAVRAPAGGAPASGSSTVVGAARRPAASADRTAPVLSGLKTSRRLRARGRGRATFRLSEPATVVLEVERKVAGGRWRRAIRKQVRLPARRATIRFRAPRRAGRYRIRLTATDAAGNRARGRTFALKVRRPAS